MEGSRKLLAAVVYGLLALAALVVIILLGKFTAEIFTAWMTGTAGVFVTYLGANVVSKFSPAAKQATAAAAQETREPAGPEPQATTAPPVPKERGGPGILGISAKLRERRKKRKEDKKK